MFISCRTQRNEKYGLSLVYWQLSVTSIFLVSGQAYIMSTVSSAVLFKILTSNIEEYQALCSYFWMHIHDIGLHMMDNAIEFTEFNDHPISLDNYFGTCIA